MFGRCRRTFGAYESRALETCLPKQIFILTSRLETTARMLHIELSIYFLSSPAGCCGTRAQAGYQRHSSLFLCQLQPTGIRKRNGPCKICSDRYKVPPVVRWGIVHVLRGINAADHCCCRQVLLRISVWEWSGRLMLSRMLASFGWRAIRNGSSRSVRMLPTFIWHDNAKSLSCLSLAAGCMDHTGWSAAAAALTD